MLFWAAWNSWEFLCTCIKNSCIRGVPLWVVVVTSFVEKKRRVAKSALDGCVRAS